MAMGCKAHKYIAWASAQMTSWVGRLCSGIGQVGPPMLLEPWSCCHLNITISPPTLGYERQNNAPLPKMSPS